MRIHLAIGVFLVFAWSTSAQHNPLRDEKKCGRPECRGGGKFKYGNGTQQNYTYSVEIRSVFNGTSRNESTLYVEGTAMLNFLTPCDGLLTLSDIKLSENIPGDRPGGPGHANSQQFADSISKNSLRFAFNDGSVYELCPSENEPTWVLNFKRGVLSLLQNSMKRLDLDHSTMEEDIRGKCATTYTVLGAEDTTLLIEKNKDLNSCQGHGKLHSIIQSVPYSTSTTPSQSLLKSSSKCTLAVDHYVYSQIVCEENHVLQPFSNGEAGATTRVVQKLVLQNEISSDPQDLPEITTRTSLRFDQTPGSKPTTRELKAARDMLKKLCVQDEENQIELSDLFSQFIYTLKLLSHSAMSALHRHAARACPSGKKHFLDAMPYVRTSAAMALMREVISRGEITESKAQDWMLSIAFIPSPDEGMIEAAAQLLKEQTFSANAAFSVAAISHTYCKLHPNCESNGAIQSIVEHLEQKIDQFYYTNNMNRITHDNLIVSLKALGSIGVMSEGFEEKLFEIIEDSNPDVGIKVAAVESFRRLPCEKTRSYFEHIFRNQDKDAEVRIASYIQIMKCPNYLLIRTIRHALEHEEVNQVGSFVWSHLNNLLKSSIPSHVEIQSLLSEKDLIKKFSSDVRKFSHNREGSLYSSDFSLGANYKSNVIFSPSSYIPKSGMLNLTVDLFGESVNLLEVNGRVEGFEHYLESLFGPKGKHHDFGHTVDTIRKRWLRSVTDNEIIEGVEKLPNIIDNNFDRPKVSLGLKVFGNELKYATFDGNEEIQAALQTLNPVDHLKRILSGKEINYKKDTMFLDSSYVISSGAGLPISINAVGTASINIKIFGSLNVAGKGKSSQVDLTVDIQPSVSLDVTGSMSVDAFYAATGLKLKTNMYTNTALKSTVVIDGSRLVSVKFSLPKQRNEIFGARSELLVKKSEVEEPQRGIPTNRVSESICSWPAVEKTVGLKLCADYHFTNVTEMSKAPYFLLAGPAGFRLYLSKSDPTTKNYLFEYKWTKDKDSSVVSVAFDTTGSTHRKILDASLKIDSRTQNLTMDLQSSVGRFLARGRYKNTADEKYLEVALDINNKKHFDASVSLELKHDKNTVTYVPKLFLGVNGAQVLQLQGQVEKLSKNNITQYGIDLKFQTKRLNSKLFGHILKREASLASDLNLQYKFKGTKEQAVKYSFHVADRSLRNVARYVASTNLTTTAYPNFNFYANVTFLRGGSHLELRTYLVQNPLPNDEKETLKCSFLVSYKSFTNSKRLLESEFYLKRNSSNLVLNGTFSYETQGAVINTGLNLKYGNNKVISITGFWSHPHTTLEQIVAHLNVTVPDYSPMILKFKLHEETVKNYYIDASGTWFSGDQLTVHGTYAIKSTSSLSNHNMKWHLKSPSFKDIIIAVQFHRDNDVLKLDLKGSQEEHDYRFYIKHELVSPNETYTETNVKYKTKLYSMKCTIDSGEHKKITTELKIDQLRDVYFSVAALNQEARKTLGFEIKWDANRDPDLKLSFQANYTKIADYNYKAELIAAYPGRTIVGRYEFLLRRNRLVALASLGWDDDKRFAVDISGEYNTDDGFFAGFSSKISTPFIDYENVQLIGEFHHKDNRYHFTGSTSLDRRQRAFVEFLGDYERGNDSFKCDYKFEIGGTLDSVPNINAMITHFKDPGAFNTKINLKYNPEFEIAFDSKWNVVSDDRYTNLTGTVISTTPFKGLNKGFLLSKIWLRGDKSLGGIVDLDLDHKKININLEGHFKKITNSRLIVNVTLPEDIYQCRFLLSEEKRHFVALVTYPSEGGVGTLGTEVLLQVQSLSKFDVRFTLDTPLEFLKSVILVAKLQEEKVDFRVGLNSLVLGFTGIWHYANVRDFEYSYKIYTPIEGYEQNGIVCKLIFKEGLDFEVSINFSYHKLGVKLSGRPKRRLAQLKEMGFKLGKIYGDAEDEKYENPISWEGLVEIDAISYPTMKGTLELDQKGPSYELNMKLKLPQGDAVIFDVFEYVDVLTMKNKLEVSTPYPTFKTISSNFNLNIKESNTIKLGLNLDYQNGTRFIKTGAFAQYLSRANGDERSYNATLRVNTPFESFPFLDASADLETEENFYHSKLLFNTNSSAISLDATAEIENETTEFNSKFQFNTPKIHIPHSRFNFKRIKKPDDNTVIIDFNMPERLKKEIYLKASWFIISALEFRSQFSMETPFAGLESTETNIDVSITDNKSTLVSLIKMHPIEMTVNSTLENNLLRAKSKLNLNGKEFPIVINCQILKLTPSSRKFNGTMLLRDKEFEITGEAEAPSKIPERLVIRLRAMNGSPGANFEYQLRNGENGYQLAGSIRHSDKLAEFKANATATDKFNWEFKLQINLPTKDEVIVYGKAAGADDLKSIELQAVTPWERLNFSKLSAKIETRGSRKFIHGDYELAVSKGSADLTLLWLFMEDMAVDYIGRYDNYQYASTSTLSAYYQNPSKKFQLLKAGADIRLDKLWEAGSNLTLKRPSSRNIDFEGHIKLPDENKEIHSVWGKLSYIPGFKLIDYLLKYHSSFSNKRYGSWGKVDIERREDMKANVDVEWNKLRYTNLAELGLPGSDVKLLYKLKTDKFQDQQFLVAAFDYSVLGEHNKFKLQAFVPENTSVVYADGDFLEVGNMKGFFNLTLPAKYKIKFIGADFKAETNERRYDRKLKAFWKDNFALVDGKCAVKKSQGGSNHRGTVLVEIPLTTRHVANVNYEYDKRKKDSSGLATVDYNGEKVLDGKYNCQSESSPGLDKQTIHVEVENSMVPIGADYVHGHKSEASVEKSNVPTVETKSIHLYHLHNRSRFDVNGKVEVRTTPTGQGYVLAATHSNRTIKLWTDYDVLDQTYKQHSRLELSPSTWIEYDLNLLNRTVDETFDVQQVQINVSYPRRNFTAQGSYNISDLIVSTDVSLMWDRDNKTVAAGLDWRKAAPKREQIQFQIKHPSFERDVLFFTDYEYNSDFLDAQLVVNYSVIPDKTLILRGNMRDNSNRYTYNYTYSIFAEHNATNLYLDTAGDVYWNSQGYGTEHYTSYKRSYLATTHAEAIAKVDFPRKEILLKNENVAGLSYLWGRYEGMFPKYKASVSAIHGMNDTTGEFYLNIKEKKIDLHLNMTKDGSQSLHIHGLIPDARSAKFEIWRDYEDIKVSDVSYYLQLNHSRLIMSSLKWRPDFISDVQNQIRTSLQGLYNDTLQGINETQQYVFAETVESITGIWQDAKPLTQEFLNDLRNLTVIEEDFEQFKSFLNKSYHANEFYMKDVCTAIVGIFNNAFKTQLQSVPKIVQEIWDVMGESGEKIKKSITWAVEKIKMYYKNMTEFVHTLINGDPVEQLSEVLRKMVTKYDDYIKDVHVKFNQQMLRLWYQTYDLIVENWHKTLAALEPTFLKFIHYLEVVAWNTSKEFLDFLYIRKTEIIGSPHFAKFTNFSQDLDKFYKDITGNNTIASIYKYTNLGWNFLKDRYLNSIPFGKELQDITNEVYTEVAQLQNNPSIKYLIQRYNESIYYLKYYYNYFDVERRAYHVISIIYSKLADTSPTALEIENKQRIPKTKFIFDPNEGVMLLEQKLPMSWHAFNETPKFQEIPEVKAIYNLQNYFTLSQTSFWNFYYDYKPYTDMSDWLPPFKGQAMLVGSKYYVTFDRKYYDFQGMCTYLLATDFLDRNFTLLVSYNDAGATNELIVLINKTSVHIDVFADDVRVGNDGTSRLPLQIGDTFIHREADIVTLDSTSGFSLECNMKFHICMFEASGWYFGKTAGLWGTFNNEPFDDFTASSKVLTKDLTEFADSWSLKQCPDRNGRNDNRPVQEQADVSALCDEFFTSKVSELSTCFPRVSKEPFLSMCLNSTTEEEACTAAVAYINLCAYSNTPLRIPDTCVKCSLLNGTVVREGVAVRLDNEQVPRASDTVFIIEAKSCNRNIKSNRNIEALVESIAKELEELDIRDNRYSVVTFGGSGVFEQPRSIVLKGETFTDHKKILEYFDHIPAGNGSSDIFNAILFANKLLFRPGVSKNFILLPCSNCSKTNMEHDYSTVHQSLLENSINLHLLMDKLFTVQKERDSKTPFGIDVKTAYTKKDIRTLAGDQGLRKSISLPKATLGFCISLALETNGSVFSGKYLESEKKNAKKFSTVFAKRFAQSATPVSCVDCECTAPNTGVSYMECYPCTYPQGSAIEHALDEEDAFHIIQPTKAFLEAAIKQ